MEVRLRQDRPGRSESTPGHLALNQARVWFLPLAAVRILRRPPMWAVLTGWSSFPGGGPGAAVALLWLLAAPPLPPSG